jgi:hypothetical protein
VALIVPRVAALPPLSPLLLPAGLSPTALLARLPALPRLRMRLLLLRRHILGTGHLRLPR